MVELFFLLISFFFLYYYSIIKKKKGFLKQKINIIRRALSFFDHL